MISNKDFEDRLKDIFYYVSPSGNHFSNYTGNEQQQLAPKIKQLILDLIAETIKTAEILPCSDKGHDDRWCYACECRKDGINDFGMQLKQIVEGK